MNSPLRRYDPTNVPYRPPHQTPAGRTLWPPDVFTVWRLPLFGRSGVTDVPKGYAWNGRTFVPESKKRKAA